MSLYGALMTGVSGLSANSKALSIASSNIANVNTIGYKTGQAAFSTLLAAAANSGDVSSSGVIANQRQNVSTQGLLTSTSSPTDLAISGNGFFVVGQQANANQSLYYTRAGDFAPDANGNPRNSSGYYLMGWPLDSSGNIPSDRNDLSAINVNNLAGKAEATTKISIQANLQASTAPVASYTPGDMTAGTVTPDVQRTINVYDSQGGTQPIQLSFVKTGANTWAYEASYQGDVTKIGGATANPLATGTMSFNADGTLATPDSASLDIPWAASTGLNAQSVMLSFGTSGLSNGVTQFDAPSAMTSAAVDGAPYGALTSVSVDDAGYVTALFDNGIEKKVFKIPVATFANADGLSPVAGNAYQLTDSSGSATVLEAKTGGAGSVASNSLEASTVDLAKEFSDLITTQRAYSAATRIITTADQMLQELMQIKQ